MFACVWLISFSILAFRLIHVVTSIRISFILFFFLETVYFPSTKFPFWWKFVEVLQVSGRRAYDHSVVVTTHSVAWAVGAADQSSVEG